MSEFGQMGGVSLPETAWVSKSRNASSWANAPYPPERQNWRQSGLKRLFARYPTIALPRRLAQAFSQFSRDLDPVYETVT